MLNQTIADYVAALGEKSSTPGGGAVAAVSGAQAAALIAMVAEFSDKTMSDSERLALLETANDAATQFIQLAEDDAKNFSELMASYKKKSGIQDALKGAAKPPLDCLTLSASLIPLLQTLYQKGNPNLITDTGIAASLLRSTIEASELNILINLRSIKDEDYVSAAQDQIRQLRSQIPELNAIVDAVKSHLT